MRTDQETLQLMAVWLEDGRNQLPDHVLDAVLEQLPSKPQRRRWSPARRISDMSAFAKVASAAAVVAVVALVGFNLLSPAAPSQLGGIASPSPEPTSSPPPLAPTSGEIEAGRYRWTSPAAEVTFAVQDGWTGDGPLGIRKTGPEGKGSLEHNLRGSTNEFTQVYTDACHSEGALEPIGDTADDLVAALDAQKGTDAVIGEVTAGGVVGQRVEIRESPGVDRSTCRYANPDSPLQIWADPAETEFNSLVPGGWTVVYVFDVDGERFVFRAVFGSDASEADVAAIDAIVESFEFSTP